jgi:hypothetical protein
LFVDLCAPIIQRGDTIVWQIEIRQRSPDVALQNIGEDEYAEPLRLDIAFVTQESSAMQKDLRFP